MTIVDQQDTQVIDIPAYSLELRLRTSRPRRSTQLPERREPESNPNRDTEAPARPSGESRRPSEADEVSPTRPAPILLAGRSLAALFAVLALVLTGGAWQWSTSKNNRLNTISALDPDSSDIVDPTGQYGDEDFSDRRAWTRAPGTTPTWAPATPTTPAAHGRTP